MNINTLKKTRTSYAEYLQGRRVVIVGPAPSILNSNQHDLIENYDVVVRLNRALPVPETLIKDIGKRTDVLYNCMNPTDECGGIINPDLLLKNGVKFLVSPYAPIQNTRFVTDINSYLKKNGNIVPFCHIDTKYFMELLEIMKLPNTGINAILDILKHDVAELYITGFTFFKGGYVKEYRGYTEKQVMDRMAKFDLHDQEKQLKYMRKILTTDKRVKTDQALSDIINAEKVNFLKKNSTKDNKHISKLINKDKLSNSEKITDVKTDDKKKLRKIKCRYQ